MFTNLNFLERSIPGTTNKLCEMDSTILARSGAERTFLALESAMFKVDSKERQCDRKGETTTALELLKTLRNGGYCVFLWPSCFFVLTPRLSLIFVDTKRFISRCHHESHVTKYPSSLIMSGRVLFCYLKTDGGPFSGWWLEKYALIPAERIRGEVRVFERKYWGYVLTIQRVLKNSNRKTFYRGFMLTFAMHYVIRFYKCKNGQKCE